MPHDNRHATQPEYLLGRPAQISRRRIPRRQGPGQSMREDQSIPRSRRPTLHRSDEIWRIRLASYEAILSEESRVAGITTTYQRLPIRDNSVPSDASHLAKILLTIDCRKRQGEPVYVHCWGGVGRTGLVAACWLQEHGRTPKAALEELSTLWKTTEKGAWRRSPETPEQVDWVKTWPQRRRSVQQLMLVIARYMLSDFGTPNTSPLPTLRVDLPTREVRKVTADECSTHFNVGDNFHVEVR